jgi:hypothetical protein
MRKLSLLISCVYKRLLPKKVSKLPKKVSKLPKKVSKLPKKVSKLYQRGTFFL